ncbi:MAG: PepSY domain-containing protein [Firmicutes bacterium]|nr:PepSY domain-containing protein [Bacillota bacterium]
MEWLKRNAKAVIGSLIILILIEAVVSWYLIDQFRENYLSADEAINIALADAGRSEEDVEKLDVALKTKKGQAWYVVEFTEASPPGRTLEYRVDAATGEILDSGIAPAG